MLPRCCGTARGGRAAPRAAVVGGAPRPVALAAPRRRAPRPARSKPEGAAADVAPADGGKAAAEGNGGGGDAGAGAGAGAGPAPYIATPFSSGRVSMGSQEGAQPCAAHGGPGRAEGAAGAAAAAAAAAAAPHCKTRATPRRGRAPAGLRQHQPPPRPLHPGPRPAPQSISTCWRSRRCATSSRRGEPGREGPGRDAAQPPGARGGRAMRSAPPQHAFALTPRRAPPRAPRRLRRDSPFVKDNNAGAGFGGRRAPRRSRAPPAARL
jgi:hypothetical protein